MVKVTTDIRFDITPVEEWPEDRRPDLTTDLVSYVERELTTDVERALRFIELAERKQLWRFIGKDSMAGLFERCELTLEAIEQYRRGVQLLRDKGHAGPISKDEATKAAIAEAKAKPLADASDPPNPTGVNQHTKDKSLDDNIIKPRQGTDTTYTLRRLARDAPEYLDKIESGELSVNAAAIAAGIRKKPSQEEICVKAFRKAENRLQAIRLIIDTLEPHEAAVVRDWAMEKLN